jgi:hypothetical protein
MGSGGKQPLDQLLASGAAHLRCYVRRRKRVEDDRANVAEEEARVNELVDLLFLVLRIDVNIGILFLYSRFVSPDLGSSNHQRLLPEGGRRGHTFDLEALSLWPPVLIV